MAKFGLAGKLGLVGRHPAMHSVYQDDFDIQTYVCEYKRDLKMIWWLSYATASSILVLAALILAASL